MRNPCTAPGRCGNGILPADDGAGWVNLWKIYEIWGFAEFSDQRAMETAVWIAFAIAGIYALYFVINYRIACSHVICYGGENREIFYWHSI